MLEEIISATHRVYCDAIKNGGPDTKPDIIIFIDYGVWRECMESVKGEVSADAYNFYTRQEIGGFPVFRVPSRGDGRRPPPYTIHLNQS